MTKTKSKNKSKLSNNLLKMKFMKRTAAAEQEVLALEEQKNLIDDEHWYFDNEQKQEIDPQVASVRVEPSYTIFENIGFGRFSFNGFNPQIEKINQTANGEDKEENDQEKEVQDKDMALYYDQTNSLTETLIKRFAKVQKEHKKQKQHHKVKRLGASSSTNGNN